MKLLILSLIGYHHAIITRSVMEDMNNKQWIDYLVQLSPYPGLNSKSSGTSDMTEFIKEMQDHATTSQSELIATLKSQEDDQVNYIKPYYVSNTVAIRSKRKVIEALMNQHQTNIKEISSNRRFKVESPTLFEAHDAVILNDVSWDNSQGTLWSIKEIRAEEVSNQVRENARQLRYANADTGVEHTHPAIASNYMGLKDGKYDHNYAWWDANKKPNSTNINIKCGIDSQVPCADDDHGTHTMSTVVGSLGLGMSPTTKWMACKNMDTNFGSPESYLGCLQFFLAPTDLKGENPRPELRPHVIGNSYTCPPEEGCSSTTFTYALKALKAAGILMSVSAGNNGSEGCGSIRYPPAIDSNSFTVGATNYLSNGRAYFSSMGPVPGRPNAIGLDVVAPGVNITGAALGGKFRTLSGTSMASPHVSGAALLIMAACPHLERQVDEVEDILRQTASPIAAAKNCGGDVVTTYPNNEFGYGKIDVGRAIEYCQSTIDPVSLELLEEIDPEPFI